MIQKLLQELRQKLPTSNVLYLQNQVTITEGKCRFPKSTGLLCGWASINQFDFPEVGISTNPGYFQVTDEQNRFEGYIIYALNNIRFNSFQTIVNIQRRRSTKKTKRGSKPDQRPIRSFDDRGSSFPLTCFLLIWWLCSTKLWSILGYNWTSYNCFITYLNLHSWMQLMMNWCINGGKMYQIFLLMKLSYPIGNLIRNEMVDILKPRLMLMMKLSRNCRMDVLPFYRWVRSVVCREKLTQEKQNSIWTFLDW